MNPRQLILACDLRSRRYVVAAGAAAVVIIVIIVVVVVAAVVVVVTLWNGSSKLGSTATTRRPVKAAHQRLTDVCERTPPACDSCVVGSMLAWGARHSIMRPQIRGRKTTPKTETKGAAPNVAVLACSACGFCRAIRGP